MGAVPAVWLLQLLTMLLSMAAAASADVLPGCRATCGEVDIPYPFGLTPSCSREGFLIDCNKTDGGLEKPFVYNTKVEVRSISLALGHARALNYISWQCYDPINKVTNTSDLWIMNATGTPYRFSSALNKFTVIGCETLAYIGDAFSVDSFQTGCVSMCRSGFGMANGSCAGLGCCQTSVPVGLKYYQVWLDPRFNNSGIYNFSRCSYAVLIEATAFEFLTSFVTTADFNVTNNGRVPIMVDWAIGNETCEVAKSDTANYACVSEHSECVDSSTSPGYLCNCSSGYQGNPYLSNGCQDIDECADKDRYPCAGICHNVPGTYECFCLPGTQGDAVNGTCSSDQKLPLSVKLAIGICSSLAFLLFCGMCIYMMYQRRKFTKAKEQYFRENGGWQLLEEIKGKQGHVAFKVFTIEELEQATNKFDKGRVLGRGGHGTVFKGILQDNRVVAIKKSMVINEIEKKGYGKEMLILSQVNHKNIVKLLGCCLEVEVPILVYEFVPNGTLFHLLHEDNTISPLSLGTRLRIAYESADALAYLHSTASPPIIHADVKSSNILLDEDYVAKVSDFGASKLVPKDKDQLATLVRGTWGYLDPEYFRTSQLRDKSDVYSFGVVLLELLTGRKAFYFGRSDEEGSLASTFISAVEENRLSDILDNEVKGEGDRELVQETSELAIQCLNVKGEERPTMREVAEVLNRLRKSKQHPWVQHNVEETLRLLGELSDDHGIDTSARYRSGESSTLNIGR